MKTLAFALLCTLLVGRTAIAQTITPGWADADGTESVLVDGDATACADARVVEIISVEHKPNGGATRRAAVRGSVSPSCQWRITGLAPGDYEAQITSPKGTLAHVAFAVTPGEVSRVHIQSSTVVISGRVTVNGAAVPRASLMFSPAGRGTAVETDIDGMFEVALPLAGDYKVRVSGESIYGQFRSASFGAGKTQWDWTLPEGRLNLHLLGAPAKGRVMMQIADLESGSTETRAVPAGDTDVLVQGVPFGVYQVFSGTDDVAPLNRPETAGVVVGVNRTFPVQNIDVPVNVSVTGAP